MTSFLFIRHARHDLLGQELCGRRPGVILSAAGRAEAATLAANLGARSLDAIYSSPLERACETAAVLASHLGLAATTAEALNEIDLGLWSGRSFDALAADKDWVLWNTARAHARPPGGEAMIEVQARVAGLLDELHIRWSGGRIGLVSHGDVIKAAVAHVLGLSLDLIGRFEIAPSSVTTVVADSGGYRLLRLNEIFT